MSDSAKLPNTSGMTTNQQAPTSMIAPSLSDLANKIKDAHRAVLDATINVVARAITAGEALLEAKTKLGHGQWLPWVKELCDLSERTAQRYMNLAENKTKLGELLREKSARLADLTLTEAERLLGHSKSSGSGRSPNASDSYDKAEKKLIDRLKALSFEAAEAAAEVTIRQLKDTISTMKAGAKNVSARAA
jgi:hypothetical protein